MSKDIGPNSNHFKDIKEEVSEEKKLDEETEDSEKDLEEEIKEEERLNRLTLRDKIVKMMGVMIIIIIIIVLIGFIISLVTKKNYSYGDVENIMSSAAKSYFSDHKSKLPSNTSQKVEIEDTVLVEGKYMRSLDTYIKSTTCSGSVIVKKLDSKNYSYTSYLDCGDIYHTEELYKKITSNQNIVTEGYGLYELNGGYVYRGKDVNNYVKFNNSNLVWRILKVNSANEVTLVQDGFSINNFIWDDRYNNVSSNNYGINTYENSAISLIIDKIYKNKLNDENDKDSIYYKEENIVFSEQMKSKLINFKSCVGKRNDNDTSRNGQAECSEIINTKIALLPVYDYINISLDPNCTTTVSPSCQNYNYLASNYSYWLANGAIDNSTKVYAVTSQGYIAKFNANTKRRLKLMIRLGQDVMVEKGKGTEKDPYIVR